MRKLKGDTLIEVTLAIGIFSMVAVAVVSVVNGSTSSAQSVLETTITREEIDAQAEALRFIQSSLVNGDTSYRDIWDRVVSQANTLGNNNSAILLNFDPNTCTDLYNQNTGIFRQGAFVINTRMLGSGSANDIVLPAFEYPNKIGNFFPASTYPRIIYGDGSGLEDDPTITTPSRIEGIYVVAVKDSGTNLVTQNSPSNAVAETKTAYYDFYIRTCWYGPGADHPSTISTVIRLYNPDLTAQ